MSTAARLGEDR